MTCFKHKLAGFRNEHEEADDVLVRYRNRTTATNLFAEQRNYRSV